MTIRPNNINSRNAPNIQSVVEVRHGAREPQLGVLYPVMIRVKSVTILTWLVLGDRKKWSYALRLVT